MAQYSQPVEDALRREIRDARARDPLCTYAQIQETLSKRFNRDFDWRYIKKLTDKVARQTAEETDRAKIAARLIQLRETHRIARERLLAVLYWTPEMAQKGMKQPKAADIAEAAKNLVMLDIAVLKEEVANGAYKNLQDAVADQKYPALPEDRRAPIISAFEKWGMLPPQSLQRIEERVVVTHATRVITTEQPAN